MAILKNDVSYPYVNNDIFRLSSAARTGENLGG
jgi:hypothetical protein